jgi:hypothetical protein
MYSILIVVAFLGSFLSSGSGRLEKDKPAASLDISEHLNSSPNSIAKIFEEEVLLGPSQLCDALGDEELFQDERVEKEDAVQIFFIDNSSQNEDNVVNFCNGIGVIPFEAIENEGKTSEASDKVKGCQDVGGEAIEVEANEIEAIEVQNGGGQANEVQDGGGQANEVQDGGGQANGGQANGGEANEVEEDIGQADGGEADEVRANENGENEETFQDLNPAEAGVASGSNATGEGNCWLTYSELMLDSYPAKSKIVYLKAYKNFEAFLKRNGQYCSNVAPTELQVLNYFYFLKHEKNLAPTTLWSTYARINACVKRLYGFSLKDFVRVTDVLKSYEGGYKVKKASIFTPQEVI